MRKKSKKALTVGGTGSDIVVTRIDRLKLTARGAAAFRDIGCYDWALFTSKNAVRFFAQELRARHLRVPQTIKVAAIGPETAWALRSAGIKVHLVPKDFSTAHLIRALGRQISGTHILFPRSAIALHDTIRALRAASARVDALSLYTTSPVPVPRRLMAPIEKGHTGYLVFMSPSAIKSFMKNVRNKAAVRQIPIVCIGPSTAIAARGARFTEVHTAQTSTRAGIARLLRTLP